MAESPVSYRSIEVVRSVSLCQPACRTIRVEVWRNSDDGSFGLYTTPVLAVGVRIVDEWEKRYAVDRSRTPIEYLPATVGDRLDSGWRYKGRLQQTGVLIIPYCEDDPAIAWDGEGDPDNILLETELVKLVVAPWDVSLDEERLLPIIKELENSLIRKS